MTETTEETGPRVSRLTWAQLITPTSTTTKMSRDLLRPISNFPKCTSSSSFILLLYSCSQVLTEQEKVDHGNVFSQKRGSVALYPGSLRAYRKKRRSPDCLKTKGNCIETLDFSISIHIIILQ